MHDHDFIRFPELTNSQMDEHYFQSPHKQITEDFNCTCTKVHDGDTITVRWDRRDFDFPIRFLDTNAPELNEEGGKESKSWLESEILGKEIFVTIDQNQRVGKWGRLLGTIYQGGSNINELSILYGMATTFEQKNEGKIPDIDKMLVEIK